MDTTRHETLSSLGKRLFDLGDAHPDRIAVVDDRSELSYSDLLNRATELIGALRPLCVSRTSVVAAQLHNRTEYAVVLAACALGGFVLAPVSPRLGPAEVARVLQRLQAAAFVSSVHAAQSVKFSGIGIAVGRDPEEGERRYDDLRGTHHQIELPLPSDRAVILLTSGTESEPKLVAHSHSSFDAGSHLIIERAELTEDDVLLATVPLTSSTGTHGLLWTGLHIGGQVVLLDGWDSAKGVRTVQHRSCTFCLAPTTILFDLVEAATVSATSLRSLRLFVCGGAPISGALVRTAAEKLGCAVVPMYGASESLAATMGSPRDPIERVTESDGSALRGIAIEARNEAGRALPAGEVGELWVTGPTIFDEYVGWPERTSEALADGWFRTGDLGSVDDDGYVRVVDRKKDIIIRGGVNVSSREVELAISSHPAVADVAVVGRPDERLGERICAFVVLRDPQGPPLTVDAIAAHFDALGLAKQRRPELVVPVQSLPRTATGKVLKRDLRDQAKGLDL